MDTKIEFELTRGEWILTGCLVVLAALAVFSAIYMAGDPPTRYDTTISRTLTKDGEAVEPQFQHEDDAFPFLLVSDDEEVILRLSDQNPDYEITSDIYACGDCGVIVIRYRKKAEDAE